MSSPGTDPLPPADGENQGLPGYRRGGDRETLRVTIADGAATVRIGQVDITGDLVDDATGELWIIGCPDCAAPAEVGEPRRLPSADGPIAHVSVECVRGHWFLMPVSALPALPAEPAEPVDSSDRRADAG